MTTRIEKLVAGGQKAREFYRSPEEAQKRRQINQERLREARKLWGGVKVRIFPSVQSRPPKSSTWVFQSLLGEAWTFTVPEVVDAWELVRDAGVFFRNWRPKRLRTEAGQQAHTNLLANWEKLAGG